MKPQHTLMLVLLACSVGGSLATSNAVVEADITMLTFQDGHMTTGQRLAPEPQLQCKRGCDLFTLQSVMCTNKGLNDQGDVIWKCDQDYPTHLQVYDDAVQCEGYKFAGDKTVLRGSCMYEYSLKQIADDGTMTPSSQTGADGVVALLLMGLVLFWVFMAADTCDTSGQMWSTLKTILLYEAVSHLIGACCSGRSYDYAPPAYRRRRRRHRSSPTSWGSSWGSSSGSSSYRSSGRSSRSGSTFTTSRKSR